MRMAPLSFRLSLALSLSRLLVFGTRGGPLDLPSFLQAGFLLPSEIDLDAEQAGSTSDKFQWPVQESILSPLPA